MEPLSWADRLGWAPTASLGVSLSHQVCDGVRRAIWRGSLQAGDRLPSSRALAQALGVGRNTVVAAYEHLMAEGYLSTRHGGGTFVSTALPETFFTVEPAGEEQARCDDAPPPPPRVSQLAQAASGFVQRRPQAYRQGFHPFRPGVPAVDRFPWSLWARSLSRRWRSASYGLACGEDSAGFAPLRDAIAAFLREGRGVRCHGDQVIVVNGAQQALDIAARLLLDPGERVLIEDPGYPGVDGALRAAGADVLPLPLDSEGLCLPSEAEGQDCRAVLLTPSQSYPLGITMSLRRRLEWLTWAKQADAWIIEDDYDSDFRFSGKPLTALQGLDQQGRTLYVGTFTRALFPSLRVGYLVVPDSLIEAARAVRRLSDGGGSLVVQTALADFMDGGHLTAHLRAMRRLYAERRLVLSQALRDHMKGIMEEVPSDGGLHITLTLPAAWDDKALNSLLFKEGINAVPLSPYYRRTDPMHGLLLGFACWSPERLVKACQYLEIVCNRVLSFPPIVR